MIMPIIDGPGLTKMVNIVFAFLHPFTDSPDKVSRDHRPRKKLSSPRAESGVGGDLARRTVPLTKTGVIRKQKVAKAIRRCQNDRNSNADGYTRAIDKNGGPIAKKKASGKLRVSPRIERARVICQSLRKNLGKERAFGARTRHG